MQTETQKIKQLICTVYDSKVRQHTSPAYVRTTEEGIRSFAAACRKEGHDFREFAEDYTMYLVGYFYPETGVLEPTSPVQIASAKEFAPKTN